MSKGVQIAVGAGLVALLVGWYGFGQIQTGSFVYYQTLAEFRSSAASGESVRVHGYVADGSIERDVARQAVLFRVQEQAPHAGGTATGAMPVVFASLETPDLFKEGAEVVVEGRYSASEGVFHASNVLAKCPSKFEGMQPPEGRTAGAATGSQATL
jgi:cytochrome c-type biogenesis protein CcmE